MNHRCATRKIAILCAVLASTAACDKLGVGGDSSPTAPSGPPAQGSAIVYTAIGASDVAGVGSSVLCPLADCPDGTGYVQVAIRQLRAQGYTVDVRNIGMPTGVIGPDFQALGRQYNHAILGNFIEHQAPYVQSGATLVTIFAGVNEVNTITGALGGGAGGSDPIGFIDNQVKAFAADYTALLSGIRSRAAMARLVILNVPNPAGLPYLSGASLEKRQAAQRAAVGMTRTGVNTLVSSSVSVVDLMCDARSYLPSNYASDGMHPNDAGYAFMAGEVLRAVTSGSYPAPQSNCSAMTIVP